MKTMRYLLMVVAMVSVLGVFAQGLAKQPEAKMQSTSTMVSTGSSLPQAAATGVYVTGSTPASYSPAGRPGYIRKDGNPFGDDNVSGTENPMEPGTPLGDVFWPLMLLAGAYALMRAILINKRKKQQKHCSVR